MAEWLSASKNALSKLSEHLIGCSWPRVSDIFSNSQSLLLLNGQCDHTGSMQQNTFFTNAGNYLFLQGRQLPKSAYCQHLLEKSQKISSKFVQQHVLPPPEALNKLTKL